MVTYGVSRDSSAATDSACGEFSVEDGDLTVGCVHKRRRHHSQGGQRASYRHPKHSAAPRGCSLSKSQERSEPRLRPNSTNDSVEYRSNGGPHGHEGIPQFEAPKSRRETDDRCNYRGEQRPPRSPGAAPGRIKLGSITAALSS